MILILSSRTDVHADAVATALRRQGTDCVVFRQEDFPEYLSISVDPGADATLFDESGRAVPMSSFATVWNRRSANPQAPSWLSPPDRDMSYRASKLFLEWFNFSRPQNQLWINDPWKAIDASNKITQLRIAREVGFSVPATIVTNRPDDARAFVSAGETIVKPLLPMFWDDGTHRVAAARLVTLSHLKVDRSVSACPMIYQRHVRKRYDLRVVVMGAEIVTARIDSQATEATARTRLGSRWPASSQRSHTSHSATPTIGRYV
jgi:hypothetical protein